MLKEASHPPQPIKPTAECRTEKAFPMAKALSTLHRLQSGNELPHSK
jgi:hypothetical protein